MSKRKNYDAVIENEIGYLKAGDYFIPVIELKPIEVKQLGKYGRMRRAFLQEYNPMLFNDLVLTGADGAVVSASVRDAGDSREKSESNHGRIAGKESGTGKGNRCYGLDKAYEYAESCGRGSSIGRNYL